MVLIPKAKEDLVDQLVQLDQLVLLVLPDHLEKEGNEENQVKMDNPVYQDHLEKEDQLALLVLRDYREQLERVVKKDPQEQQEKKDLQDNQDHQASVVKEDLPE